MFYLLILLSRKKPINLSLIKIVISVKIKIISINIKGVTSNMSYAQSLNNNIASKPSYPEMSANIAEKAEWTKQGSLRLSSGWQRFLSAIVPGYARSKADQIASEVLNELKTVYYGENLVSRKQRNDLGCLGYKIYELNPSPKLEKAVFSYSQAILLNGTKQDKNSPATTGTDAKLQELGLTSNAQTRYPDLIDFLNANQLKDYMEGAGLKFGVADNGEPLLPVNGQMTKWSQARAEIFGDADIKKSMELPLSWRFDSSGLQKISVCEWSELKPCKKEEAHPGEYFVDIMTTTQGLNHSWIRLVNDDGEIISVGLCGQIHSLALFRGSVGRLNSPDHREFMPEEHRRTRILIDKKQYESLKNKIETDQRTHNHYFNLLSRNCGAYALEVVSTIGLIINNKEYPTQIGIRSLCQRVKVNPHECAIKVVSAILGLVRPLFGTLGTIAMGAWYQDGDVKQLEKQYGSTWTKKPNKPFRSVKSFFDGTNSQMLSTFKVADWQNFVQRYRKERLEFLQLKLENIDKTLRKTEEFEKEWQVLQHRVAFEMPPGISDSHLFIHQVKHIETDDLTRRMDDLVFHVQMSLLKTA